MLTRKQLTFLKYLKAHEPLSYDEILDKYSESELSRTFDILLQNGYITTDSPPVISLYSNRSKPRRYYVSDKGTTALELSKDQQHSFITRFIADKAANIAVSAIVAFITAVITYIVMPYLFPFLSWK